MSDFTEDKAYLMKRADDIRRKSSGYMIPFLSNVNSREELDYITEKAFDAMMMSRFDFVPFTYWWCVCNTLEALTRFLPSVIAGRESSQSDVETSSQTQP